LKRIHYFFAGIIFLIVGASVVFFGSLVLLATSNYNEQYMISLFVVSTALMIIGLALLLLSRGRRIGRIPLSA